MIANAIIAEHYLTEKDNTDADEAAPTPPAPEEFSRKRRSPAGGDGASWVPFGGNHDGGKEIPSDDQR